MYYKGTMDYYIEVCRLLNIRNSSQDWIAFQDEKTQAHWIKNGLLI
jgi:hypothetical protein